MRDVLNEADGEMSECMTVLAEAEEEPSDRQAVEKKTRTVLTEAETEVHEGTSNLHHGGCKEVPCQAVANDSGCSDVPGWAVADVRKSDVPGQTEVELGCRDVNGQASGIVGCIDVPGRTGPDNIGCRAGKMEKQGCARAE